MCEGASKQTQDLKILPRRDRAPPRFEIPGSATGNCFINAQATDITVNVRLKKIFFQIYNVKPTIVNSSRINPDQYASRVLVLINTLLVSCIDLVQMLSSHQHSCSDPTKSAE